MKRVIWGIIIVIISLLMMQAGIRNSASTKSPVVGIFVILILLSIGIIMIFSGRKYLILRNEIIKLANNMNNDGGKIDVNLISNQLNCSEFDTRLIIAGAQNKGRLPDDVEIDYTGKGKTKCYLPYAMAENKGWEIIVTDDKINFIMVFKVPVIQTVFLALTTPLYLLPIIGQTLDLINISIFVANFKEKTKKIQSLSIEEKLNRFPKSYTIEVNDIKSVNVGRKIIEFKTSEKSYKFRLFKRIKLVCPQFNKYLEAKNIEVNS